MRIEDGIKTWTAKRKTALVLEIIQGKAAVAETSRAHDLSPSQVETWAEEGKRGVENATAHQPLEVKEQHEHQVHELQAVHGEAAGAVIRSIPHERWASLVLVVMDCLALKRMQHANCVISDWIQ